MGHKETNENSVVIVFMLCTTTLILMLWGEPDLLSAIIKHIQGE